MSRYYAHNSRPNQIGVSPLSWLLSKNLDDLIYFGFDKFVSRMATDPVLTDMVVYRFGEMD